MAESMMRMKMLKEESDEGDRESGDDASPLVDHSPPKKESYTEWKERLDAAISAVAIDGMSFRQAAKAFSVSKNTIIKHIRSERDIHPVGSHPWLSAEVEKDLCDWGFQMTKIGYPHTKKALPVTVQQILNQRGQKVFPNDNLPTHKWVSRFIERHPELSLRIHELGPVKSQFCRSTVSAFFRNLKEYLKAEGLNAKKFLCPNNAPRVFNSVETGVLVKADDSAEVLVKRGTKAASQLIEEGKDMATVVCCASAVGHVVRPLIVNSGKALLSYDHPKGFDATSFSVGFSNNGWVTSDIFHDWLTNVFERYLQEVRIRRPVLLFLDGRSSHLSLETLAFAHEKKILMYYLPPHCHAMEPVTVSIFNKYLTEEYKKAYKVRWGWERRKVIATQKKKNFAHIFMMAVSHSIQTDVIKKGFQTAGLLPFDPRAVKCGPDDSEESEESTDEDSSLPDTPSDASSEDEETAQETSPPVVKVRVVKVRETLPPVKVPEALPPVKKVPEALPPVKKVRETLPPVKKVCETLPPVKKVRETLPPVTKVRETLPPVTKVQETSTRAVPHLSLEECFNRGFIEGQRMILRVAEEVIPPDELALYKSRDKESDVSGLTYRMWRELLDIHPCPEQMNPYLGCHAPALRAHPPTASESAGRKVLISQLASTTDVIREPVDAGRTDCDDFLIQLMVDEKVQNGVGEGALKRSGSHGHCNNAAKKPRMSLDVESDRESNEEDAEEEEEGEEDAEEVEGEESDGNSNGDDDDDDDECGVCLGRSGTDNDWVGCQTCDRWFHKRCVGVSPNLSTQEMEELEFICTFCENS